MQTHTHRPRSANTKLWTLVGLYRPRGGSIIFFLEAMMMEGVLRNILGDIVKHLQVQGVVAHIENSGEWEDAKHELHLAAIRPIRS